jgi:hypothetical protein
MRVGPQTSNRGKPMKPRRRLLNLTKLPKKYSGSQEERFGPILAAEHLADEVGIVVDQETLRRWVLAEHLWSRWNGKKHCQTKGGQGALWRAGAARWAEVEMKLNDALASTWPCGYTRV